MIAPFRLPILVVAVALACCSCQPPPGATAKQAASMVVDLDAVAKALGWDAIIAQRVESATQNLNAQLIQAAATMEKELQQQQAALGATPTQEQLAALQKTKLRVQQNIQNNKLVAEQARDGVRNQQILLFRKEVRPVAAKIAADRGSEVVLIANDNVVWFAPSADITGEVIAALRARNSLPVPEEPATGAEEAVTNQLTAPNAAPPVE